MDGRLCKMFRLFRRLLYKQVRSMFQSERFVLSDRSYCSRCNSFALFGNVYFQLNDSRRVFNLFSLIGKSVGSFQIEIFAYECVY